MTTGNPNSVRRALALLVCVIGLFTANLSLAADSKKSFDIPAGKALAMLKQFTTQSGEQLLYSTDAVEGVTTHAVKGTFTAREVLGQMVNGTSLAVVADKKNGALSLVRAPDPNAPRAVPAVASSARPEKTEKNGTARGEDEETVVMSPFEVVTDTRGYYASSTLSGTRLNSKIEDLASSISVVTKQQMIDNASIDLDDIFLYEANTEGGAQFSDFEVDRNRGVQDNQQDSPTTSNRLRGIGAANIARGNFASNSMIPADSYNLDAVEISRGPNSNIFGLGAAAGTVNLVPSRARLNKPSSQISLRTDSYGSFRSNIDLNRPLGKKLAVRISALYDDKAYVRKPSADVTRRGQAALTFHPFKNTTIRGSYESYNKFARRPNIITPRDNITPWIVGGKPTWDPVTFTVTLNGVKTPYTIAQNGLLPYGLWSQATSHTDLSSMFIDNGGVALWTVGRLTTTNNPTTPNSQSRYLQTGSDINVQRNTTKLLFAAPGFSDKSLYDWSSINAVARNYAKGKADIYSVEIEQFFLNTPTHVLAANAGWYLEDSDRWTNNYLAGVSTNVVLDINERLLDGTPNPYFLRPYISAPEPLRGIRRNFVVNDNVRAQIAYQLDLTRQNGWMKWLGQHRLSGYGETRRITSAEISSREVILDNHSWLNAANRANGAESTRIYYRFYVGDNQGYNFDYAPAALYGVGGTHTLYWRNGVTGQWINESALIGEADSTSGGITRREIRSQGLVTQNFFLNDRLVTIFGWRTDKNRDRTKTNGFVDPATGLYDYSTVDQTPWRAWTEKAGTTKTQGVVLRPLRGWDFVERRAAAGSFLGETLRSLNFHYNESDTFQPAATAYNNFGEQLPQPTGNGRDYGLSLSLFSGKFNVRFNRYETNQIDSRKGDAAVLGTRAFRMDFAVDAGTDPFILKRFASGVIEKRFAAQGVTPTSAQMNAEVAKFMGLSEDFIANALSFARSETSDIFSKGLEIEAAYNPNRFWTLKLNVARQQTIDSHIAPNIQRWIDYRLPVWQSIKDDAGIPWFTTSGASEFLTLEVLAPLRIAIVNQGKPRSQVREWRFNATTSYNLAGISSDRKWLNNLTVGGAMRWEDKASIGFLGMPPDSDGVIRDLDRNKPVYDKARAYFDAFASYRLRLFKNKIGARVQLNVRNMFEGGRLQTIGVNPDGTPYQFRIIDPRLFILTMTFDL